MDISKEIARIRYKATTPSNDELIEELNAAELLLIEKDKQIEKLNIENNRLREDLNSERKLCNSIVIGRNQLAYILAIRRADEDPSEENIRARQYWEKKENDPFKFKG